MELDLTSFSTTLAVGLALALVTYFGLRITYPTAAEHVGHWLGADSGSDRKWLPLLGTGVILLGIGIMCEDLSKNVLSERKPGAYATQLQFVLQTESLQRCKKIVDSPACEASSWKSLDAKAKQQTAPIEDLGLRVIKQLENLASMGIATPEEAAIHANTVLGLQIEFADCSKPEHKEDLKQCVRLAPDLADDLPSITSRLYYAAKNIVYTNEIYQSELESIRLRYGFERSIAFVLVLGIYGVSFVFLAKSAVAMWTDVGGWKTGFSLLLLILLILTLVDVTAASDELRDELCKLPPFDKANPTTCRKTIDLARTWILPATLVFVVGYRVRRLGKRLGEWLRRSRTSTIPGPPLLMYQREIEAWRVFRLVAILAALLLPTSWAYHAEQDHYLGRVFGYYETFRGNALECNADAVCTKRAE